MSQAVEQIKDRLNIVDVISSYIKVEKSGINYKGRCPFHNEKTPSFFISPSRQTYYCFGCGEKGDIFSFVEKFEGLDFKGALKTLAEKAGVELKDFKNEAKDKGSENRLWEIMEEACKWYEANLNTGEGGKEALAYIKKRGLSEESILKWRIGFAKDEWRDLHDTLISKGFSREEMMKAGLIKKADGQEKYYDTFRDRIMFPISDTAGRVIAFSGRSLKDDPKAPKYLNSPETELFYKSETLYGLHIAKNYIRKLDYAVLVEGQMDLCMSHQAGVLNTVASSGTALTELHLKKIGKLANRIILAYDADEAGKKAAMRAGSLALSLGMETKIAILEEGEDPASVVKSDPENWKKALRESEHIVEYTIQMAIQKKGREQAKAVIQEVLPLISLLKSAILKSQYIKRIASKMMVSEEAVLSDLLKVSEAQKGMQKSAEEISPKVNGEKKDLDRIITGIIFAEEASGNLEKSEGMKRSWMEFRGQEEVEAILESLSAEKEALIFETENFGLEKDYDLIFSDLLKRMELKNLKDNLIKTSILLDSDMSQTDKEPISKEITRIQNRIRELDT